MKTVEAAYHDGQITYFCPSCGEVITSDFPTKHLDRITKNDSQSGFIDRCIAKEYLDYYFVHWKEVTC